MTAMRTSSTRKHDPSQGQLELSFPSKYLTIDQVAELLAVPKSFIYRRTARGHDDPIPHYRLGGHLRFKAEDIEAWVESHRCQPERTRKITAVAAAREKRSARSTRPLEQPGLLR